LKGLNCDWCHREFKPTLDIPQIILVKKIASNDLTYSNYFALMDLCDVCSLFLERYLGSKTKLRYKILNNKNHVASRIIEEFRNANELAYQNSYRYG